MQTVSSNPFIHTAKAEDTFHAQLNENVSGIHLQIFVFVVEIGNGSTNRRFLKTHTIVYKEHAI